ncbi:MAG: sugar phosphate isomerase/epimerase [Proteobacteria bacterium]|nr:MAG: sugar phosphate isomerase/epimerase [Pseudomonadota bacterium]
MTRLGFGDLVLCAGSAPAAGFLERVAAAAAHGFAAISLFPHDYQRARAAGLTDADLRAALRDSGVAVAEIDPLLAWMPGAGAAGVSDAGRGFLATPESEFYAIADALGARSINAALADPGDVPLDAVAGAFAALCDRAAAHGLLVTLEFLPWTKLRDAATAASVVERAGRANGGVMLDAWHHFRSGAPLASVDAARVFGIQLGDAPAQAEPDPIDETLHRRLAPGEGDAPLAALVRHLAAGKCPAPIGVEVFSDALAAEPVDEIARRLAAAVRTCLRDARI